jgi:hypothetical protein
MGFDMKKLILWTTASILLPAIILMLAGCMKPPSTAIDKGPEASCQSLDSKISDIQRPSVLTIKKSEFAYIESTARIENFYPELTQQYAVTVMSREEDDYMVKLMIQETLTEKVNGQFKPSTKEGPAYILKKTAPAAASAEVTSGVASGQNLEVKDLGVREIANPLKILGQTAAGGVSQNCQLQKDGKVKSYNNLEVSDFDIPIPQAVKTRDACGGLTDCNTPIKGKLLKFDRWINDPNNAGKEMKVTTYLVTTSHVPYFATIFSQCVQYSWPVETRQVLVTSCDDVKDFKFGTP